MSAGTGSLHADVRRERILALLARDSFVRVSDLSMSFGVSQVTARNDLDALARDGRILRVRGGAVRREISYEQPYEERRARQRAAKLAIGRAAAALVQPGESVILDVGTTTVAAATALVRRRELTDVTAFTNGLHVALELERAGDRITTVVTGGTLRRRQHSLVDPMGTDLLARVRVDTAFLGCTGVDGEAGFTNENLPETAVKHAMLRAARRRVFLADGHKLGVVHLALICPVEDADLLITSDTADASVVDALRDRGLEVIVAGEQSARSPAKEREEPR